MNKVFSLQLSDEDGGFSATGYISRQEFPWGTAVWLTEPDGETRSRVTAGFFTFHPFCTQPEHGHMSEEQILYVISGKGKTMVDGLTYELHTGSYLHIRPHARHVMFNDNPGELRILVVYIYSPLSPFGAMDNERPWYLDFLVDAERSAAGGAPGPADGHGASPGAWKEEPFPADPSRSPDVPAGLFNLAGLEAVLDRLAQALEVGISLLDADGRPLFQAGKRAALCAMLSKADGGASCRRALRETCSRLESASRPLFFSCCCNVSSIIVPVVYRDKVVAYLQCGAIFLSTADRDALLADSAAISARHGLDAGAFCRAVNDLPIEPRSRLHTAAEAAMSIAGALIDQAETQQRRHELNRSRLSLVREQLAKAKLEKALHESGLKLLQSQVNPHFLFNTLNTISQMAYLEGARKASALTRDLSELLRYTLRNSEQLIPLREELALLSHYINIQKERFGDRIGFSVAVDQAVGDLSGVSVPCMILQPLVENAIVHGLESRVEGGTVDVSIRHEDGMLAAAVRDNGCGFDPTDARHWAEDRVGLKSTRGRLALHYGKNFRFSLRSAPGQGCEIILGIPMAVPLRGTLPSGTSCPFMEDG